MKRIALVGTVTLDEVFYIDHFPKKHEITQIVSTKRDGGGILSNCGIVLARLDPGLEVDLYGMTGPDERGEFLDSQYAEYPNLNRSGILRRGNTPYTHVLTDCQDMSRTFLFDEGNCKILDEDIFRDIRPASLVHVGYPTLLGRLDDKTADGTRLSGQLKILREAGQKVSLDLVSSVNEDFHILVRACIPHVDHLIMNEMECGKYTGHVVRNSDGTLREAAVEEGIRTLRKEGAPGNIIIHAPEGCIAYEAQTGKIHHVRAAHLDASQIKGTVGAGDAFAAGYLYATVCEVPFVERLRRANLTAAALLVSENGKHGVPRAGELYAKELQGGKHAGQFE